MQVPPAELEHLLNSNPEVADAAVIPYGFIFFKAFVNLFLNSNIIFAMVNLSPILFFGFMGIFVGVEKANSQNLAKSR